MDDRTASLIEALQTKDSTWDSRHDEEIARFLGWQCRPTPEKNNKWYAAGPFVGNGKMYITAYEVELLPFSGIIDEAYKVIPIGYEFTLGTYPNPWAEVWNPKTVSLTGCTKRGDAATVARALCIAGIRMHIELGDLVSHSYKEFQFNEIARSGKFFGKVN